MLAHALARADRQRAARVAERRHRRRARRSMAGRRPRGGRGSAEERLQTQRGRYVAMVRRRGVGQVQARQLPRRGHVLGRRVRRGRARDVGIRFDHVGTRDRRRWVHREADDEPVREAGRETVRSVR